MAILLHMPMETTKELQVLDLARTVKILRVHELSEKRIHPEHQDAFINEACWCRWAVARNLVIQERFCGGMGDLAHEKEVFVDENPHAAA